MNRGFKSRAIVFKGVSLMYYLTRTLCPKVHPLLTFYASTGFNEPRTRYLYRYELVLFELVHNIGLCDTTGPVSII